MNSFRASSSLSAGPLDKLLLALKLFNTYTDNPIISRNEQLEDPDAGVVQKLAKYTKVTWPGLDNVDEYTWIDEQGNLHLKSVENDLCELILSQNCVHFKVIYLYLVPNKKPQWVNLEGTGSQQFNDEASAYRSQMSASGYQKQGTRVMKMMYEYVRVEQIHSLAQFPERWAYPLGLLLQLNKINPATDLAIASCLSTYKHNQNVIEIIRGREYQTPLPENSEERSSHVSEAMLNQTLTSVGSYASKFLGDAAQTVKDGLGGHGVYDKLSHKSLLEMSIKSGQAIEDLLANNP